MRRGLCLILCCVMLTSAWMTAACAVDAFDHLGYPIEPEYLNMRSKKIDDWQAFYELLDSRPELKKVDIYKTVVTESRIEELTERYPNIEFGMTIKVGDHKVRTDATTFSTLHSSSSKPHRSSIFSVLKYCPKLRALDLGHNSIDDISFLYDLPELRVLIIARNKIKDLTPIASLEHLEYLEIFSNRIEDVTPLTELKYLAHLNIGYNRITDTTPLLGMKSLKRLWIRKCTGTNNTKPMSEEIIESLKAALSGCIVDATHDPSDGGWRDGIYYKTFSQYFKTGVYKPFPDSPPENR